MKILCVADHVDPIVYSNSVKERFRDVDIVLSAGDLPMDYLGFIVSSLNKPLYFVFGNHNLKYLSYFNKKYDNNLVRDDGTKFKSFGSIYIGFKGKYNKKNNLLVMGLGGCKNYNKGKNQYTELHMYIKMFKLVPRLILNKIIHGRYLDILLTHAAPEGINDRDDPCHRGFRSFKWFLRKFTPEYMLHGHIHLYDFNAKRDAEYHKTKIINVYDHYILNYTPGERRENGK